MSTHRMDGKAERQLPIVTRKDFDRQEREVHPAALLKAVYEWMRKERGC